LAKTHRAVEEQRKPNVGEGGTGMKAPYVLSAVLAALMVVQSRPSQLRPDVWLERCWRKPPP